MFPSNTNSDQVCDKEGNSNLGAGLLITAAATTTTTDSKYGRVWRRSSLCLRLLILINKGPNYNEESPQPSPSSSETYAPLPQEPPDATEQLSRTSSARSQHVIEIPSENEDKKEPSPSSSVPYAALPQEPPAATIQFSRTSSIRFQHVIEIHSENEEKKKPVIEMIEFSYENVEKKEVGKIVKEKVTHYSKSLSAPLPQEPPAASEKLSRSSSAPSRHLIDNIPSKNEKKKEWDKIAQIVKEKDLKSLRQFGGVNEVEKLRTSLFEARIDGGQDQKIWVASSGDEKGFLYFLLEVCSSSTILLLLASAGLSFAIDIMQEGRKDGWHDGVAILVTVVLLVAVTSVGNFRRQRKMVKKLSENMSRLEVTVERSGQPQSASISGVKVGDIVLLNKGDCVPADGLLLNGNDLALDEAFNNKIDRDRNPFLFSGSKVIEGNGRMLVTAVGADTTMGKEVSLVTHEPNEKSLLEARIEKPNDYIDKLALCVTVLIALVVLIHLLCWKHSNHTDLPEIKGDVPLNKLIKIFEGISMRSQGKIWILTSALTAMVIAIQHGMPFVITVSLFHWKEQVKEYEAQNLSACLTMGLVTVICFDATGGRLMCNQVEFKNLVQDLKDAGVNIKLVSEDEPSAVKAIARELEISMPGSNDVALKGVEIQARMEEVGLATVIGSLLPEDKLRIVKCLKRKGDIVAYFGGLTTSDTPALKEADVGITDKTRSTELARESSDIIVEGFGSLVSVLKFGRCAYHNIQKFTQLQLTACISGLLITLLTTMIAGESPITGIELIWLNLVMYLLGGLMMVMKFESQELLTEQTAKRTQSLITKDMWRDIAIQVLYQASILLIFQFKGQTIPSMNDDVRKTMIFNTFILCQIFNQFNVMDILQIEVLRVVLQSYWFLVALVAVLVMQVMVIEFFGSIANYVRLNAVQWALCFLFAALSWGFDWALKVLPLFLTSWSVGTHYEFSNRMTRPYFNISSFSIPFFMFLFFSVSYYLNTGVARTSR